jgi:hypothetical protein
MKMKFFVKVIFLLIVLTICSCAQVKHRTIDRFNPETGVYYNESIPLQITFPNDWVIYKEIDEVPDKMASSIKASEDETDEIAMFGHHISKTVFVIFALVKDIRGLSPIDYAKIIKKFNKSDFATAKEYFLTERYFNGRTWADWKYKMNIERGEENYTDILFREALFLLNGYACRLRFYSIPFMYDKYESTIEKILTSIMEIKEKGGTH